MFQRTHKNLTRQEKDSNMNEILQVSNELQLDKLLWGVIDKTETGLIELLGKRISPGTNQGLR